MYGRMSIGFEFGAPDIAPTLIESICYQTPKYEDHCYPSGAILYFLNPTRQLRGVFRITDWVQPSIILWSNG